MRNRSGKHFCAPRKLRNFEYAYRTIPDDRSRIRDDCGKPRGGFWSDIQDHVISSNLIGSHLVSTCLGRELVGHDDILRDGYFGTPRFHHRNNVARLLYQIGLSQRAAYRKALREHEGIGNTPANN